MEDKKRNIDWLAVENEYRPNILSLRAIADKYGCTEGAIRKKAKQEGWVRNLSEKIKSRADDLVRREAVRNSTQNEKEIIDANAENNAAIQLNERKDVTKSRNIVIKLVNELENQIDYKDDYGKLGEMLRNPDQYGNDKLNDVYMKTISFSGRVDGMKKLSDSLKTLIDLERRVYKIDDDVSVDSSKRVSIKVNFYDA